MGTAIASRLGDRAIRVGRDRLDLTELSSIDRMLDEISPDGLINCAAYTKVDRAESEEDLATRVNTEAVSIMASWAGVRSVPFLTFSTDYVFDGKADTPYLESSATNPVNAYGRSKLGGEQAALAHGGLVARTSWVVSGTHPNFVATILRIVSQRSVDVVADQRGSPSIVSDLAATSLQALDAGRIGLVHVTNRGSTTWFELAREAVRLAGRDPELVKPCSTADFPTDAPRPAYSVLGSERIEDWGLDFPPHWTDSLPDVVAELCTWV